MDNAYNEQVREGQKWIPLAEKVATIEQALMPNAGDVVSTIHLKMKYHPALSSISLPASTWYSETGNVAGLRVIHVPTLAQLGYGHGYSYRAHASAIIGLDDGDVDVRVLNVTTSNVVASTSVSRADVDASAAAKDFVVELPSFVAQENTQYFIDVRHADGTAPAADIRVQNLLLQIIKD